MRILIMGLSGSGKTTLTKTLSPKISARSFNADAVRKQHDDWDFSHAGRIRQAHRMRELADFSSAYPVICDFIAPLQEMRDIYAADYTVWVDTVKESPFKNTDAIFEPPTVYDIRVTTQNAARWAEIIKQVLDTILI